MRFIVPWSVAAVLLCAATAGCVDHTEQLPVATRTAVQATPQPQPGATLVLQHGDEKGVTAAQPSTPAARPQGSLPPVHDRLTEERARVSEVVTLATQQMDRLTRMQQHADPDRQSALAAAVDDLQGRREKVLQDMREMEIRGPAASPSASDTLNEELYRDLGELQGAVRDSYAVAPPPGSGMAPPAPLPPRPMP